LLDIPLVTADEHLVRRARRSTRSANAVIALSEIADREP